MKKIWFLCLTLLLLAAPVTEAAPKWQEVADRIAQTVDQAVSVYETGDYEGARDLVNSAYYGIYEKDGLENVMRSSVSAKETSLTEYQFYKVKKSMKNGESMDTVRQEAEKLKSMVNDNVKALENAHSGTGWAAFLPAYLILLREGLEAILVLVAIIAYLKRANDEKHLGTVYNFSIAAVVASFISAYLFNTILNNTTGGMSREVLEGATALFAVAVLLLTSAWLGGKASKDNWKQYIDGLVKESITHGTARALGMAAFLAVYREGAEVILFYQALFNNAAADVTMIWAGFGAGCVTLAVIFYGMQQGILKIPLRPFFLFTSILMFLLAVTFVGGGIEELQEGGVIGITRFEGWPTFDVLGIFPTAETLGAQLLVLLFGVGMVVYSKRRKPKAA
ncbi:FTR1 family protein [uncultured Selenomonas sp.]|uniref:FTR1 family iron permease n=1 Tax=uncultured Selenomonas sp. TaxID=159275 RepID=UPI0028DCE217|nr:FTR1 family protein [uncultured Selenomonas sp.]